jgi:hypothetical protein
VRVLQSDCLRQSSFHNPPTPGQFSTARRGPPLTLWSCSCITLLLQTEIELCHTHQCLHVDCLTTGVPFSTIGTMPQTAQIAFTSPIPLGHLMSIPQMQLPRAFGQESQAQVNAQSETLATATENKNVQTSDGLGLISVPLE